MHSSTTEQKLVKSIMRQQASKIPYFCSLLLNMQTMHAMGYRSMHIDTIVLHTDAAAVGPGWHGC